jgi:hypothetical protein
MRDYSKAGHGVNLCLVVSTLMTGDRTRNALMQETGLHREALDKAMKLLHRMGLAYRRRFDTAREVRGDGTIKSGPYPVLWAWNSKPFANRDFQEQA